MHIPPDMASVQSINLDAGINNNKRTAEAQRAKEARKRLLGAADSIEADPDAILLIGQWLGERPAPSLSGDHYTSTSGRDSDFD